MEGSGSHIPCDQVQTVTVEFGEATDLDALADTLEALGYTGIRKSQTGQHNLGFNEGHFDGQTIRFYNPSRATPVEVLKRSYTKATVTKQADRFGWAVKVANKALVAAGFSRQW
jgi:hypothetical protein